MNTKYMYNISNQNGGKPMMILNDEIDKALSNYLKIAGYDDDIFGIAHFLPFVGMGVCTVLLNMLTHEFGWTKVIVSKRTYERSRLMATDNYPTIYKMIKAKQWGWLATSRYMVLLGAIVGAVLAGAFLGMLKDFLYRLLP